MSLLPLATLHCPPPPSPLTSCREARERERAGSCHTEKKRIICWLKIFYVSTNPKCLDSAKLCENNDRNSLVCEIFATLSQVLMKLRWWLHTLRPKTDQWRTRSASRQRVG